MINKEKHYTKGDYPGGKQAIFIQEKKDSKHRKAVWKGYRV